MLAAGVRFCSQCGAAMAAAAPVERSSRRQMTVLFCDLVQSTDLSARVDPDDLLDALAHYRALAQEVSSRYGGTIARIVGDGLDIYFGYPMAGEDDSVRACHAALELSAGVSRIEVVPGEILSSRIGVATGTVAISASQGLILAGLTPNLAGRIQASVPPGAVGVGHVTRRLTEGQFEFEAAVEHSLKGFDEPVPISILRGARSSFGRSASRGRDASRPMVGRETELALLKEKWDQASSGRISGAVLLGDAGLGKSRLVTALEQSLLGQPHAVLHLQCSPFHTNNPLQPFVQHIVRAAGFASGDDPDKQADKLEAQLAIAGIDDPGQCALIAALVGVQGKDRYPPLNFPPPMQLHLTKEVLRQYFLGLSNGNATHKSSKLVSDSEADFACHSELLMVCEDMHWVDPTSLELVNELLSSSDVLPIFILMTSRYPFQPRWEATQNVIEIALRRLPEAQAAVMVSQVASQTELPMEWLTTIVDRADGIPLYIEELASMLIESRAGSVGSEHDPRDVPDSLMGLLAERLDRLPPAGRQVAQYASVIGREFDQDLLAAVAEQPASLLAGIEAVLDSGLVLTASANNTRLRFKHALIEDTAYASLPAKRCAELHGRVADALLNRFSERIEREPELAARHLTRARREREASTWWQAAGGQALSRGAPREAAGHLRNGVAAVAKVPAGIDRDEAELGLLSMLGPTTMVLLGPGSGEFGDVQQRAHELSRRLPGQPRLFPTRYGWSLFNWGRAQLETAGELAQQLLDEAALRPGDPEAIMAANNMAGMVQFHCGCAGTARDHLVLSTSIYEPQRDAKLYPVYLMDFGVFGRFYLALANHVLGFADDARRIAAEALTLAEGLNQPHTLGFAMLANFNTAVMRRDPAVALPMAERCLNFAEQFGFPEFVAMARIARGWALAHAEQRWDEALVDVQAGIVGWQATGFENWQPWFTSLEAEILGHLGQHAQALTRIEHQLQRIAANGEHQFESLLLAEQAAAWASLPEYRSRAQAGFDSAASMARDQGAVGWLEHIAHRRAQVTG